MHYLCLIYYDEKKLEDMAEDERDALCEEAYAYCDEGDLKTDEKGTAPRR